MPRAGHQNNFLPFIADVAFFFFDSHAAVVAHMLVRTCKGVEYRGFAAIGVARDGQAQGIGKPGDAGAGVDRRPCADGERFPTVGRTSASPSRWRKTYLDALGIEIYFSKKENVKSRRAREVLSHWRVSAQWSLKMFRRPRPLCCAQARRRAVCARQAAK
jgi:hypothetical protein